MDEEFKNQINQNLAVMFTVNMICMNGLRQVYKDIDKSENPEMRIYFRNLVTEAVKILKSEGIKYTS